MVPKSGIHCIEVCGHVCESPLTMSTQPTLVLAELTTRLGELADRLWLNHDPVERRYLLQEFRIVLDLADEIIAREYPVKLDHPTTSEQSLRLS
jgi:hypothetical protein